MSWSYSTTIANKTTAEFDLDAIQKRVKAQNPDGLDQIDVAMTAAYILMQDASLGSAEEFYVSMSGHANPGHKPQEGWANDAITVSVTFHK